MASHPAESTTSLTVLIVSWNDWEMLRDCLTSMQHDLPRNSEILVVVNGSVDGTSENLKKDFPQVRIQENPTNLGHTKGVNIGFSLARGDLILLLDSDTEARNGSIAALLEFMQERPDVDVATGRIFNDDGSIQESAKNLPTAISGIFGRQSVLTRLFPNNAFSRRYLARQHLGAREPFQVEQVGSQCLILRRELIDTVGPWDERYFGYWVDTDWCMSLRQHRKKVYCVPAARFSHHESNARQKRKSPKRIWDFHLGAYKYYTKWHSLGRLDPRSFLAGWALIVRAALLVFMNALKHTKSTKDT